MLRTRFSNIVREPQHISLVNVQDHHSLNNSVDNLNTEDLLFAFITLVLGTGLALITVIIEMFSLIPISRLKFLFPTCNELSIANK